MITFTYFQELDASNTSFSDFYRDLVKLKSYKCYYDEKIIF